MTEPRPDAPVALVLAGGCARGAYEFGALSVLLPELEKLGQRPRILVGTSVGALNATYLGAKADVDAATAVAEGERVWRQLAWTDVIGHVVSLGTAGRVFSYLGQVLGWPGARVRSLLDSTPLAATIAREVPFDRLQANVEDEVLLAAGVVTTSVLTHQTVVFHTGGGSPPFDGRRLISYVGTPLGAEHVCASTAMPAVFPAVSVQTPAPAAGWYYDGGTRLNAPLKPALEFGAERLVVIGLSSLAPDMRAIAGSARPDLFAGIGLLLRGLIGDQLAQDLHTLAAINANVLAGDDDERALVPYIAIAPAEPDEFENMALAVFRERYGPLLRGLSNSADIELVGRLIDGDAEAANATLLSLLLFDAEFIEQLIELGAADARRWIGEPHDEGLWQLQPLPTAQRAPAAP
jgi:NTE family protein